MTSTATKAAHACDAAKDLKDLSDAALKKLLQTRLTVTVPMAAMAVGLSRGSAYKATKTGEIPVIKIGQREVVPTSWLRARLGLDKKSAV
jgi:hypothetical protein